MVSIGDGFMFIDQFSDILQKETDKLKIKVTDPKVVYKEDGSRVVRLWLHLGIKTFDTGENHLSIPVELPADPTEEQIEAAAKKSGHYSGIQFLEKFRHLIQDSSNSESEWDTEDERDLENSLQKRDAAKGLKP